MKENNEIIVNEEEQKKEKVQDFWYRKAYEDLTDIPSRVAFFMNVKLYLDAAEEKRITVTKEEKEELAALETEFVNRYIRGGSEEEREGVFRYLGKLRGKNTLDSYDLYRKHAEELSPKDPDHIRKSKWYFDGTIYGRNHKALDELTTSFTNGLPKKKGNGEKAKQWVIEGRDDHYREQRLSSSVKKAVSKIEKINSENYNYEDLKGWIDKVGNDRIRNERIDGREQAVSALQDRFRDKKIPYNASEIREQDKLALKHYKSLKTMEEKLSFMMDFYAMTASQEYLYGQSAAPGKTLVEMENDFCQRYITKADMESAKKVFRLMGEMTANNLMLLSGEYEKAKKEFEKEGNEGAQKAEHLSRYSVPGIRNAVGKKMAAIVTYAFGTELPPCTDQALREENIDYYSITVKEFQEKYGVAGKKVIEANSFKLEDNQAKQIEDMKVLDLFRTGDPREEKTEELALNDMKCAIKAMLPVKWMEDAKTAAIQKAGFDMKKYAETNQVFGSEIKPHMIQGWSDKERREKSQAKIRESSGSAVFHAQKQFDKRVGFDQYIMLHTGAESRRLHQNEMKECLAKAIAADILKDAGASFNVKQIHKAAKLIQEDWDFQRIAKSNDIISEALKNPDALRQLKDRFVKTRNQVKVNCLEKYLDDMRTLAQNMMPSEGRSDQYKNMYDAVKRIADLKIGCDFKNKKDVDAVSKEVAKQNQILLNTIDIYVSGKEKIRRTEDGKERFDNAMDALSILAANVSERAATADSIMSAINKKRGVGYGEPGYISVDDYGANRAISAKQKREDKNKKNEKPNLDNMAGLQGRLYY